MDAGVAAVLGAAAGALTPIVTGWMQRSSTKMQMRAESLKERREPRRSSYDAFASAAAALHDHLQPWVTFGRLLDTSRTAATEGEDPVSYLRSGGFKEGYIPRAIELADEVSRCGRHVALDGPAGLEPFVTKTVELSGGLVAPFRIMQSFSRISDGAGESTVAYKTSAFPGMLKELEQGVRDFLLHASTALDRGADRPSHDVF
ncbi:hypothetical protein [Streptomyces sp. NPDC003710]